MSFSIVDKRKNGSGRNLPNRQRFIKRYQGIIKKQLKENILDRSISSDKGADVLISTGIDEPHFYFDGMSGDRFLTIPGNDQYVVGDIIMKPPSQRGQGNDAGDDGDGEDEFSFSITKEEYLDLLFDGLELPALDKINKKKSKQFITQRAGFSNDGNPTNLDIKRTMKNSIGRGAAFSAIFSAKLEELKKQLEEEKDEVKRKEIEEEIKHTEALVNNLPLIDPVDLRYRNYEQTPVPAFQAVVFMCMDVSGSMSDMMKEISKRFYLLFYLFIEKQYDNVDIVFIRYHSNAMECSEQEFFYSRETGGTVTSTAFETMSNIQEERYPVEDWNIYVAHCSDGDNFENDNPSLEKILESKILPIVQMLFYIQVSDISVEARMSGMLAYYGSGSKKLLDIYKMLGEKWKNIRTEQAHSVRDIYPMFRKLFSKENDV